MATYAPKSQHWVGSVFRPCRWTIDDLASRIREIKLNDKIKYMSWQLERCPSTSNLHVQYYLKWKNTTTRDCVRKALVRCFVHETDTNPAVHVEKMRGTNVQVCNWCHGLMNITYVFSFVGT